MQIEVTYFSIHQYAQAKPQVKIEGQFVDPLISATFILETFATSPVSLRFPKAVLWGPDTSQEKQTAFALGVKACLRDFCTATELIPESLRSQILREI